MSYVRLGKSLRKCRRSINPPYSQQDLAVCIHSQPVCQGIFPLSVKGPVDLIPVIEELEAHGTWTLPLPLLDPFLEAAVNCLAPACRPDFLIELSAIIVESIMADLDPAYTKLLYQYLPQQGNSPEEEAEEDDGDNDDSDDDDDDDDKGND